MIERQQNSGSEPNQSLLSRGAVGKLEVPEFIVCFEHGILHWVVQQNSPVVTLVEVAGFLAPLGRFVPSTTTKEAGTPWQRISLVGKHLKRTSLNLQHSVVTQWLLSGCWDGFVIFTTPLAL